MTDSIPDRIRARLDAPGHALAIKNEFAAREPGQLDALTQNPLGWIGAWPDVELIELREGTIDAHTSRCSIEGGYQAGPPAKIGVAISSHARMSFTVLHELAHHLQRTSDGLSDALGVRDDAGAALEEAAADVFAASILVPEFKARAVLGTSTPRAADVARLWEGLPNASRHAVIVRAAQNLDAPGHITILDEHGVVAFSSAKSAPRLRTGSDQSRTDIGKLIASSDRDVVDCRTRFAFGALQAGDTMYAQAAPMGLGHTVVVASVERVPWTLSVNLPQYVPYGQWRTCEYPACAHVFLTGGVCCANCKQPTCPECGRCDCGSVLPEFTCTGCFLIKGPADASESSGICIDCV
jgi:hypothetical protein